MTDSRDAEARSVTPENEVALSALLDGELAEAEAARLRARLRAEPGLAARFAELAATDAEVAALAGERLPEARLAALRLRLEARVGGEPPARARRPVAWMTAAAAALAAGLTLYLVSGSDPPTRDPEAPLAGPIALAPGVGDTVARLDAAAPGALGASGHENGDLDAADLAIALEFEVLADFEVIENLALLEALVALDAGETM